MNFCKSRTSGIALASCSDCQEVPRWLSLSRVPPVAPCHSWTCLIFPLRPVDRLPPPAVSAWQLPLLQCRPFTWQLSGIQPQREETPCFFWRFALENSGRKPIPAWDQGRLSWGPETKPSAYDLSDSCTQERARPRDAEREPPASSMAVLANPWQDGQQLPEAASCIAQA